MYYFHNLCILIKKGGFIANIIYLKLNGKKQGLISRACSSIDSIGNKYQNKHIDEILIYELSTSLYRDQNTSFQPIDIKNL